MQHTAAGATSRAPAVCKLRLTCSPCHSVITPLLAACGVSWQVSGYPTSIASLAFSPQGDMLAVASSSMNEVGQREAPPDAIFIRPVQDGEVKPKPRKTAPQQ